LSDARDEVAFGLVVVLPRGIPAFLSTSQLWERDGNEVGDTDFGAIVQDFAGRAGRKLYGFIPSRLERSFLVSKAIIAYSLKGFVFLDLPNVQ
jgi:hypothetical protein